MLGGSRSEWFSYIKDRLWKKLKGWKEKLLGAAGKEILIKVVGQSLPIYSMNCLCGGMVRTFVASIRCHGRICVSPRRRVVLAFIVI